MGNRPVEQFHQRQNSLTEGDVELITAIVQSALHVNKHQDEHNPCRFSSISPEDMMEAVKFFKNTNKIIEDSKSTVRRTLLGIIVVLVVGFLTEGFWSRALSKMKQMISN